MAKTKTSTEDIIEKKESSPVATAALIVSCAAMLGAIAFCVTEIMHYREGLGTLASRDDPGMEMARGDLADLEATVNNILNNTVPEDETSVEGAGEEGEEGTNPEEEDLEEEPSEGDSDSGF